ncbi:MAG TPA: RNA polymerase sigma factor [Longibacter sp.]
MPDHKRTVAMYTPTRPCESGPSPSVQALKRGDEQAFRCLVEQESERLRRFVLKIIGDPDEARNIVQETFAEAYRQIDDFRGEAKVSTWLFSIARHQAYGFLRNSDRQRYLEHDTIEYINATSGGTESDTYDAVNHNERRGIVHDAIRELPDHYQRVVVLRDLEEHSTKEAAEKLGLTPGNVRVRLHRARKQLKDHLCRRMEC